MANKTSSYLSDEREAALVAEIISETRLGASRICAMKIEFPDDTSGHRAVSARDRVCNLDIGGFAADVAVGDFYDNGPEGPLFSALAALSSAVHTLAAAKCERLGIEQGSWGRDRGAVARSVARAILAAMFRED